MAKFQISGKSPLAEKTSAVDTSLPLQLEKGNVIGLCGNLLLDNERRFGYLETLIQQSYPELNLKVRNFSWPADEPGLMPRPGNAGSLDQHLTYYKADVVIAAFGYNSSFKGAEGLEDFSQRLRTFIDNTKSRAYNGKKAPKVVILGPTPDCGEAATRNNKNIELYSTAMEKICTEHKVGFVNLYKALSKPFADSSQPVTTNGHALNDLGHKLFSQQAFKALFNKDAAEPKANIRAVVLDKNFNFDQRFRPLNSYYYTGGRSRSYGYLDFLPAMRNFDILADNRDKEVHALAQGKTYKRDDSNLPPLEAVAQGRGANIWKSPADEMADFTVDPRFAVNLFASEEEFPEIACPISIRWDRKGRLWVSCSTVYPHLYPGQKPEDKIVILEDTDNDGKADKCTTFADDLHIPLSFELDGKGGVYVSEQPHLTYLKDTDGDGKADHREIIYTGFGVEDSHHSIHDLVWTPGGDLMFRESVFHHSQVETPYGPVRAKNSTWFLYNPTSKKLTAFGCYRNTNPWGVSFDNYGNHMASHPVFASSFHATNPPYPAQHPRAVGMQAYSGVCGHDMADYPGWQIDGFKETFVRVRYKPTNRVELHGWIKKEDHFEEERIINIIFSKNLSFIPVDCKFGPDNACYVADWYNPIKGHAQYALRDPRRDRKSGRIWRITQKTAKVAQVPVDKTGTITALFKDLDAPHYRLRYWARRDLRGLPKKEVVPALAAWLKKQSSEKALLEGLWMQQSLDAIDPALLEKLIRSKNELIAAAAFGPLRFCYPSLSTEKVAELLKYGASHPSQHVRREAVICASYTGGKQSLEAILPALEAKAGVHLHYAIETAFTAEALAQFWVGTDKEESIRAKIAAIKPKEAVAPPTLTREQKAFDRKTDLIEHTVSCIPERLQFTKNKLVVTAGSPVKIIFKNPDATKHNFLILTKDASVEKVGLAATEMARTPEGEKKHFIPELKEVMHATKLIGEGEVDTLRFIAPKEKGNYPFVCTFPGHWVLMKGVLVVK